MILEGGDRRAMEHSIADDWAVKILDFNVDFFSLLFALTLLGIEMTVEYVRASAEDDWQAQMAARRVEQFSEDHSEMIV